MADTSRRTFEPYFSSAAFFAARICKVKKRGEATK